MESFFENLYSVAASDETILDFVNFYKKVHNLNECKKEDCDINIFVSCIAAFLKKERSVEIFMDHCFVYKKLFHSMFMLSKNKTYCLELLQILKGKENSA